MSEIIERLNRQKQPRYSYKCADCNTGAGEWPGRETAKINLKSHKAWCEKKPRCQVVSREPATIEEIPKIQCLLKDPHQGKHIFPGSEKVVSEPLALV